MVKALVEAHKGKISVTREEKNGTTFIIELPVKSAQVIEEDYKNEDAKGIQEGIIEKINIEFSDIYDINLFE